MWSARRVMSMREWRMHVPPPSGLTTHRHQKPMQDYHKAIPRPLATYEFISELHRSRFHDLGVQKDGKIEKMMKFGLKIGLRQPFSTPRSRDWDLWTSKMDSQGTIWPGLIVSWVWMDFWSTHAACRREVLTIKE